MRQTFPAWYPLTPHQRGALTRRAIFSLDANVLLNLYGVQEETRNTLLRMIRVLAKQDRIWLPHQAALEYQSNRAVKFLEQLKAASELRRCLSSAASSIRKQAEQLKDHPFVNFHYVSRAILEPLATIQDDLLEREDAYRSRIEHDEVRVQLDEIFSDAVGKPYSEEQLHKIFQEGKKRYEQMIPPGYADSKRHGGSKDEPACYGDLVLWKQLLDEAKRRSRPIVLVTEDWRKGDWYWKAGLSKKDERSLGPRPELIEEMFRVTGKRFYVCRTSHFSEWIARMQKTKLPVRVVDELNEEPPPSFSEVLAGLGELLSSWRNALAELGSSSLTARLLELSRDFEEASPDIRSAMAAWQPSVLDSIIPQITNAASHMVTSIQSQDLKVLSKTLADAAITPLLPTSRFATPDHHAPDEPAEPSESD